MDFREIVTKVTTETGRSRSAVSITYREDPEPESEWHWIVGIACKFAGSRTRGHYTCEGYGATAEEAATDAVTHLQRAIADGRIKGPED